ncbi:hypothetical protein KR093_007211 [Drosophila rubida]|uniref:G-protein coupled receptors family 2 profile 2 domain-containing protein n=1 Tax=Drosophila rubida TaxID=30044 RepID=A0AAD4JTV6_9MUSC|nr:hypothetical protein KR093_007211 [Drosophila rubida]
MQYCEAEYFEHTYHTNGDDGSLHFENHVNLFRRTEMGKNATMRDLCLDSSGLPVRRLCEDKSGIATWEQLKNVSCQAGNKISWGLNQLHEELLRGDNQEVISAKLRHSLSEARGQLTPVDVYITAQIFTSLVDQQQYNTALSANLISICSELMNIDANNVLWLSAKLNATNVLLDNFEKNMDALSKHLVSKDRCGKVIEEAARESAQSGVELINYADTGVQALLSSNLSVFYVNPACNNITGMAIFSAAGLDRRKSSGNFWYSFFNANKSVASLKQEDHLEIAVYLPGQLWRQLQDRGASFFVLKVYANDALFVETSEQRKPPSGKVLSITIPEFDQFKLLSEELPNAVQFLLRKPEDVHVDCAYWNYQTWRKNGITTGRNMFDDVVLCETYHLTQFAALLGVYYLPEHHKTILTHATYAGCGLSLFGMLGIFLTAVLVSKWRAQASTKVLLNLCFALTQQLTLFLIFTNGRWTKKENCWILGPILHYSVLVIFSWMLIISLLQYQRYVTVLGVDRPHHYIFISAIVAWTLPLIPTLLIVLLDNESYKLTPDAFCYPSNNGLLLGVVLPIALVTIANALMMMRIVYSVNHVLSPRRKLIFQQLRLFVLLFFLLGISWIFGLCSYFKLGIAFSYLFCLTTTLQGFVLFLYFVPFNATHRLAWLQCLCPKLVREDVPKHKTQIQSTTFSTSSSKKHTLKVN